MAGMSSFDSGNVHCLRTASGMIKFSVNERRRSSSIEQSRLMAIRLQLSCNADDPRLGEWLQSASSTRLTRPTTPRIRYPARCSICCVCEYVLWYAGSSASCGRCEGSVLRWSFSMRRRRYLSLSRCCSSFFDSELDVSIPNRSKVFSREACHRRHAASERPSSTGWSSDELSSDGMTGGIACGEESGGVEEDTGRGEEGSICAQSTSRVPGRRDVLQVHHVVVKVKSHGIHGMGGRDARSRLPARLPIQRTKCQNADGGGTPQLFRIRFLATSLNPHSLLPRRWSLAR